MDREYEEREGVLSILRGVDESWESYSSITDFKQDLGEEALAHEELGSGWVLYEELLYQHKIIALLKHVASQNWIFSHCLIQFWGVVKVEGSHHSLSSSHHPFYVSYLDKGLCWYRKLCRDHEYVGDDDQQLGGVGRVYRNRLPESTPDLKLYSTHEFPMRDEAARCGFKPYIALPLFDSNTQQCYGVLEILQNYYSVEEMKRLLCILDRALQVAGLRSNHNSITTISEPTKETMLMQQPANEIREVLELAMATIPRLYLAQVWIPCNSQCLNFSPNLCCMEMVSFIDSESKIVNPWGEIDGYKHAYATYLQACEFHKLQVDLHSCHSNLCGLTVSENSLAHYAQRARMSHCIAVSHRSNGNNLYVIQFFLQPKYIQNDHSLHLLLRILETNLKSVIFVSGKQLVEEYARPDAIECESIDSFSLMKFYKQNFWELKMTTYLMTVDSCCLKPASACIDKGWVFSLPAKQSLCKNHAKSNSSLIRVKMEGFMRKIAVKSWKHNKWIVQFWAPKMEKNRCYLETSDQPYAVGCLAKGIASFKKQCSTHYYFVDDQAKQDEFGPPGRVFTFEHPETSPDLFYYTREEFPLKNFAMLCCNRGYLALPVFDDDGIGNYKLVGVLEFLGFYYSDLPIIRKLMEAAKLCSTHIDFRPRFLINEPANIINCRKKALNEICRALNIIDGCLPQLYMANVWVPIAKCASTTTNNRSCMELALSTDNISKFMPTDSVPWIHVKARKGMVGMVLASENKSCFCPNLSEFSIVDQPLSHYDMSDRRDACFAICLQSSDTGNLLYVMEFFLYQGPATHKYVGSFLSLLLPIIKHELESFKLACGKQLGEELVVEVIEFSDANKLDSSELEPAVYPVIFKSVQYNQKEYHHVEEEKENEDYHIEEELAEECNEEEQHAEEWTVDYSHFNTREREKRENSLNLSAEVLESHFGKKLKDVAKELGVGRSTVKRACREHGIRRWPNRKEHKKNPSLFEEESYEDSEQDMLPSTGNVHPLENVTQINTESAEKVIVKVKYNEDLIKFELSLSLLGLAKLTEEVATSLNLEMGSFKLKYMDEDGDEILLTSDADLQLCPKTQTTTGNALIQLLV
ncbi:protein NLP6-like isoform X1 [Salvia divinorum]|uniref:Protein NLP6-like isoform X1 n=1 Tax=Salvia divinorum TaxID=28513 RepID=A0ABD1GHI0_SALDI